MVFVMSGFSSGLETGNDMRATQVLSKNCSTIGCHSGLFFSRNLSFEEETFKSSLIDTSSQKKPEFSPVNSKRRENSSILMNFSGDQGIVGSRMTFGRIPLNPGDSMTIEQWLNVKKKETDSEKNRTVPLTGRQVSIPSTSRPAFWGTTLINLPTTQIQDKGQFLFRISHRYFPAVKNGYDDFYGLDGPAVILFGFGYALGDKVSLTLSRSNRLKEVELGLKWIFIEQGSEDNFPLSLGVRLGTGLITQANISQNNQNFTNTLQFLISRQWNDRFSVLFAPSYASNTKRFTDSTEGTFALGIGMRHMIFSDFSVILEWNPVIAGYVAESSGWGLGLEWKLGGHVFQVFFLNSVGITSSQYLPGGDFRLKDAEFRFGFNIFRLF